MDRSRRFYGARGVGILIADAPMMERTFRWRARNAYLSIFGVGMSIGENIRRVREAQNVTLTELGKRIQADPSTIQRWEKGQVSPTWITIERIAKGLRIPASDLIVDKGSFSITGLTDREYNFLTSIISDRQKFHALCDMFDMFRDLPPEILARLSTNMSCLLSQMSECSDI